jgi:hypothetical protein
MNFMQALTAFSNYCAVERRLSVHTLQAYYLDLQDFYKWLPRDRTLDAIDVECLKDYLGYGRCTEAEPSDSEKAACKPEIIFPLLKRARANAGPLCWMAAKIAEVQTFAKSSVQARDKSAYADGR